MKNLTPEVIKQLALAQLLAELPYRLLATGHPRVDKDARAIYWVKGRCLS